MGFTKDKQIHRHSIIRGLQRNTKGGVWERGGIGMARGEGGMDRRQSFKFVVVCYLDCCSKKRSETGWMTDLVGRNST